MKTEKCAVISATMILILSLSSGLWAQGWSQAQPAQERSIRVQGEGRVTAVPDQAELQIQVSEDAAQAETASALAKSKMEKIFATLKASGIPDKDIQTMTYSVQPKMVYDKDGPKKDGYTVSNGIKVVVKKMDLAGKLLAAVIQDGANNVDGPNYTFSDPDKLKIEALKAAVQDAGDKASAMAQSAGVQLGPVYSVAQLSLNMPEPRPGGIRALSMNVSDNVPQVPLAAGENEVVAQVEVVYSLK